MAASWQSALAHLLQISAAVALLLSPATGLAAPVVRRTSGANPAAIQATVDQFRTDLGGANNGVGGNPATGRREINWDGVPDVFAAPNALPATFFNVNSPRGAVFATPGSGFQVSGTPAEFGNFNATYPTNFVPFSATRLFTAVGSGVTDVTFRVPGTNRPASVSGFGVVFTDVDVFGTTTVEFFDERGFRIGPVVDSSTAFAFPSGLSFVGVSFNAGERVARVRITSGDLVLSTGASEGAGDVVAMDDFIYGEPQAMTGTASIDTSFSDQGTFDFSPGGPDRITAVLRQPDDKIVMVGLAGVGSNQVSVVRLLLDGSFDTSFSGDGRALFSHDVQYQPRAAALQPDGAIVVVGDTRPTAPDLRDFSVLRILPDGTLDVTFDGDGRKAVSFGLEAEAHAVAIQPDGKILVAGQAAADAAVVRLLPDGSLDATFNPAAVPSPENGNGRLRFTLGGTEVIRAIGLGEYGEIVLAGGITSATTQFLLVRLLPTGAFDPTFDGDGATLVDFGDTSVASSLVVLPDGRIVAAGRWSDVSPDFAVARVRNDGTLDTSFNPVAMPTATNGSGRLVFSLGGADVLTSMALQPDGKLVLAGYTTAGGGVSDNAAVYRLTADGVLDATFGSGGGAVYDLGGDEELHAVMVQRDGRLLVAGQRNFDFLAFRLLGGPTPGVYITTPSVAPSLTASSPFVTLKGTAGDDVAVSEVTWTNDRGFSGTARGTTAWAAEIPLVGGVNVITVVARDASGSTSSDTITMTVNEFVSYLAEGATGTFFDLDILLANPTDVAATVDISYLLPNGSTVPQAFTLGANTRRTVKVDQIPGVGNTAVSAVIRSTNAVPIVVERTMFWDGGYYGGHTGNAVDAPRTRWLFGEGSQGFFDTYVLLANANATTAMATVTFLVEGGPNVVETLAIAPTSRLNVYAGAIPALANKSFSIVVTSTQPIIAERAMYFGQRLFEGGHESAGVGDASTNWFHAEGATGSFFDTYILVGNPNPTPANLTVTFLKGDGTTLVRNKVVPANGRFTLFVDGEDPALADTAVSTIVVSDIPVVSERAMYWAGSSSTWFEAHNSFGVTSTATKWALAEGRVGQGPQFETYVLVANPTATMAQIRATFLRTNGSTVVKTYDVLPTSRFNIWVNAMVPELANEDFGVLVEVLNGVNVAVERALYWTAGGVGFAGGTNATAVRVP